LHEQGRIGNNYKIMLWRYFSDIYKVSLYIIPLYSIYISILYNCLEAYILITELK